MDSGFYAACTALVARTQALDLVANNLANTSTPGFSRQRPILQESFVSHEGGIDFGTGVTLEKFQSVRDQLLQLRLYEQTSQQGDAQSRLSSLQQVEGIFADTSAGIGGAMSAFFTSLSQLSANPTNMSARQQVLTSANNIATSFHQTVAALNNIESGLDRSVPDTVNQINQLTEQIAKLNGQVAQIQGLGQDAGITQDQRDELIRQLSNLVNISVTETGQGLTLTTGNGVPLVVSGQSYALQTSINANSQQDVFSQGQDITSQITGGTLAGILNVRDQAIPSLMSQIDTLASEFATQFNTAHTAGFDLNGAQGVDFFTPQATIAGAAANFGVAITDPRLIAASSDGSVGSNGNLAGMIAVRDQQLPSGASPMDVYSNLVLQAGSFSANAKADSTAADLSVQQLTDQRGAISGVSLDEETTNMIRYQRAYQAAARIVTTVNSMYDTLMNMGVGS